MKTGSVINIDPAQLNFSPRNRLVDSRHVARLKNAISKNNLLHLNPIKINPKREIIDGQHRITAALELELAEVPCLVVNATIDDAPLLNQHAKNWSGLNFAQYYAANGKKDYKLFLQFVEDTHLKASTAMRLLAKGESYHLSNFKNGTFRIGDLTSAYAFMDKVSDFRDLLPMRHTSPAHLHRSFVLALKRFVAATPSYDHKRMMNGIKRTGLRETSDVNIYTEQLRRAYGAK